MKTRNLVLAGVLVAATAAGCAAISGLDSLEEVACAPNCGDASVDSGDTGTVDTGTGDTDASETTTDSADAEDSFVDDSGADSADADALADSVVDDSADTAPADTGVVDSGSVDCGSLSTVDNCSACGVVCDDTRSVGRVCDGTSCQYGGCLTGWADCKPAAPNADGCETPTTTVNNCGGCGNACDTATSNGASCDGTTCKYTSCKAGFADCSSAAPNADGCETPTNTVLDCGGCGVKCEATHSGTPSCDGTKCTYSACPTGRSDCDTSGANANGCECATPACCGTSCAVTHSNCASGSCGALGQSYFIANACAAAGTPGTASTYTLEMADGARAASPTLGGPPADAGSIDASGTCTDSMGVVSNILIRETVNSCFVWAYSGPLAGRVYIAATDSCNCPSLSSPTWN